MGRGWKGRAGGEGTGGEGIRGEKRDQEHGGFLVSQLLLPRQDPTPTSCHLCYFQVVEFADPATWWPQPGCGKRQTVSALLSSCQSQKGFHYRLLAWVSNLQCISFLHCKERLNHMLLSRLTSRNRLYKLNNHTSSHRPLKRVNFHSSVNVMGKLPQTEDATLSV